MAKILVSMKDNFLKSVDEIALREQRSRSELIREALRTYLQKAKINQGNALKNANILDKLLD